MDPIDYRILDLLQRDARTTQVQIAEAVGLSQPSVADRIHKLDQSGAVLGYVARLDARRMGNDIRAFIGVRVSHPRHHEGFTRRIQQIPSRARTRTCSDATRRPRSSTARRKAMGRCAPGWRSG